MISGRGCVRAGMRQDAPIASSWVSELGGVYLFTNRQGENALTLAATSLAERLRKGTARVLSQDRLTDRAVAQLLQQATPG